MKHLLNSNFLRNFRVSILHGDLVYPYSGCKLNTPSFYSVNKTLYEPSEWIIENRKVRFVLGHKKESNLTHLKILDGETLLGSAYLFIPKLDSGKDAHGELELCNTSLDTESYYRLLHTVAQVAATLYLDQHAEFSSSIGSTQSFAYTFSTAQIAIGDALFQQMSKACLNYPETSCEIIAADVDEDTGSYCSFSWSGPIAQLEELGRVSTVIALNLGIINTSEDFERYFSLFSNDLKVNH